MVHKVPNSEVISHILRQLLNTKIRKYWGCILWIRAYRCLHHQLRSRNCCRVRSYIHLEEMDTIYGTVFFIDCRRFLKIDTPTAPSRSNVALSERDWQIAFQWIPSHIGVVGNERVDELTGHGTIPVQALTSRRISMRSHL